MSYPHQIALACEYTKALRLAIDQLKGVPSTGQELQDKQGIFRASAGWFVEAWSCLIPTMQAMSSQNPIAQPPKHSTN